MAADIEEARRWGTDGLPFPTLFGWLANINLNNSPKSPRGALGSRKSRCWAPNSLPGAQPDQSKRPRIPHKQREAGPFNVAVTVGFEPTLAFTPNNISSVAPSAARTRHQLK